METSKECKLNIIIHFNKFSPFVALFGISLLFKHQQSLVLLQFTFYFTP